VTPVVVGIGTTPFTRRTRASAPALAARAIEAAVRDARVGFDEIDGVVRFDRGAAWEYDLPGVMRLRALDYYGAVPDGPGSAPALVRLAAMAVSLGLARVVVGYHARAEARPDAADVLHAAARGGHHAGAAPSSGAEPARAERRAPVRGGWLRVRDELARARASVAEAGTGPGIDAGGHPERVAPPRRMAREPT